MADELIFAPTAGMLLPELGYASVEDVLFDPRGRTIRCTPRRRTVVHVLENGRRLYRKIRSSSPARARAEWQNLGDLRGQGIPLPEPFVFARRGQCSVVGILDVPGRPLDVLLAGCHDEPARRRVLTRVADLVRKLHGLGYCYRDLYWAHLFSAGLCGAKPELSMVDVERAFRPRLRWRRWRVKDLAGLLASWPAAQPPRVLMLRMMRDYLGDDFARSWKPLAREVMNRARRTRAHRPRFGDLGFRW